MFRRFLVFCLLALLAPLTAAVPAGAATKPCNVVRILAQAVQGGSVPKGYSLSCLYRAKAAADQDPDLSTYTAVGSVLRAAILQAGGKPRPPANVPTQPEGGGTKTTTPGKTTTSGSTPARTVVRATADVDGKPSGDGGDLPTPVIALGVVALAALVAAVTVELRRRRA
jgi:hypothetical protein